MTLLEQGLVFTGHFIGGVSLSLTDRRFSLNAKRNTDERVAKKIVQAEALEYLVQHSADASSQDYLKHVMTAKEYFRSCGKDTSTPNTTRSEKLLERIGRFGPYERINNLYATAQLGAAVAIELAGDAVVATTGLGDPVKAITYTPAQVVGLFMGLQAGKGVLYAKDYFTRSKDEVEIDGILRGMTKDDKLLQIVRNYSPTANVEVPEVQNAPQAAEQTEQKVGLSAKEIGSRVGEQVVHAAGELGTAIGSGISTIKQRITAKRRAEEEARTLEISRAEEERKQKLRDFERNLRGQ
ncbi:MAG: hypothetical protein WCI72_02210 [archaeon]